MKVPKPEQFDLSDVFGKDLDRERLQRPPEPYAPPAPLVRSQSGNPNRLLLIIVFVIWARLGHYAFVEDWGARDAGGGRLMNGIFILVSMLVFLVWAYKEWRRIKLYMIPSALVVFLATKICLADTNFGSDGYKDFLPSHPVLAAIGATVALLVAASQLFEFLMNHVMEFLDNPIKKVRKN